MSRQSVGVDRPPHVRDWAGRPMEGDILATRPGRRHRRVLRPRADEGWLVVVHTEHVDRGGDDVDVGVVDELPVAQTRGVGEHIGRVVTPQDRLQEEPVVQPVDAAGRVEVRRPVAHATNGREVEDEGHLRIGGDRGSQRRHGEAVSEQEMVRRGQRSRWFRSPGSVVPVGVPEERGAPRFVQRAPVADPIPEARGNQPAVIGKAERGVAIDPTARILELLREIPVVESEHGADAGGEQLVH